MTEHSFSRALDDRPCWLAERAYRRISRPCMMSAGAGTHVNNDYDASFASCGSEGASQILAVARTVGFGWHLGWQNAARGGSFRLDAANGS